MILQDTIVSNFWSSFETLLNKEPSLDSLLKQIAREGDIFVVGGYFRNAILEKPDSRDIDVMVDVPQTFLDSVILSSNIVYNQNRLHGYKLYFPTIIVDIWSVEKNWAFSTNCINYTDSADKLHLISQGCFYNYDSPVINVLTNEYNIKYFSEFCYKNELDILIKERDYIDSNPTRLANILRVLYLRKEYDIDISVSVLNYIRDTYCMYNLFFDPFYNHLIDTKARYSKYSSLSEDDVYLLLKEIISEL